MAEGSDATIVILVLAASASVLAAPVLGRLGAPILAEIAMWSAAGCGVAAFGMAGRATLRAARRDVSGRPHEESE